MTNFLGRKFIFFVTIFDDYFPDFSAFEKNLIHIPYPLETFESLDMGPPTNTSRVRKRKKLIRAYSNISSALWVSLTWI